MIKFYSTPLNSRPHSKQPIYEPYSIVWETQLRTLFRKATAPVPQKLTKNITEMAEKWVGKWRPDS